MHVSWEIGETRREVVRWFARRVRDLTLERRMAFLAGFWEEPYPNEIAEEACRRRDRRNMRVNDPNDLMFVTLWCDVYTRVSTMYVPYLIKGGEYTRDSTGQEDSGSTER